MATVTPDYTAESANKYQLQPSPAYGAYMDRGTYTASSLAQNKVVAVLIIPAGAEVFGVMFEHAALGANTALSFGYTEVVDQTTNDVALFGTVADASTANQGAVLLAQKRFDRDAYLVVKQTGAGTATGAIVVVPFGIYRGGK